MSKQNKMIETIQKTREYLDYIERHYNNVQKAFLVVEDKLKNYPVIRDEINYWRLRYDVIDHDLSKLSKEEFVQYRQFFFPIEGEVKDKVLFQQGWLNHWTKNNHHWQNIETVDKYDEVTLTHMVIDWMGMSYEFGDTALEYYNNNKDKINLTNKQRIYVEDILNVIYE